MGLFSKKSSKELMEQGKNHFDRGNYSKAALSFLKVKGEEKIEAYYWLGLCHIRMDWQKPSSYDRKTAEQFLTFAAKKGHVPSAMLLAEKFGITDYLPAEPNNVQNKTGDAEWEDALGLMEELEEEFVEISPKAVSPEPIVQPDVKEAPAPSEKPKPEPQPAPKVEPNPEPKPVLKHESKPEPKAERKAKVLKPLEKSGNEKFQREKMHLNVGILGHLDHGKTTLTGAILKTLNARVTSGDYSAKDLDKLPYERERGLTVVGNTVETQTAFRHYALIDCPGHADFTRTTVSKIAQMDAAILVVDAHDGIRAQTVEHLILARGMGITNIVVFLDTHAIDEQELAELIKEEILELLEEYDYPYDTPIICGDARQALESDPLGVRGWSSTGYCIMELMSAVDDIPAPDWYSKPFLMAIDKIYERDQATIVTGTVENGEAFVGDKVDIVGLKHDQTGEIVSIETFRKVLDSALIGDPVAIALRGVKASDVKKGQVLAKPCTASAHRVFKASIRLLTRDEGGRHTPVLSRYRPQFYFRTAAVTGEITIANGESMIIPGERGSIEADLVSPVAIEEDQKFIIRDSGRTIGYGTVTEIIK